MHISPKEDDAEGVHHTLALTGTPPHLTRCREVRVPEDAASVAHALALLFTLGTGLVLFLAYNFRTLLGNLTCLVCC